MENLAHIIVKIGAVREDYYFDGELTYHDVNGKVYECSNCGKRIGEHKLHDISVCPHCGVKFEVETSDVFKEKCEVSYNDFELCNEAYDEIFGESTCESTETVL